MRLKKFVASFSIGLVLYGTVITPAKAFVWVPLVAPIAAWIGSDIGIASIYSTAVALGVIGITFNEKTAGTPANLNAGKLTVMLATKTELPNRPADYSGPVFPNFQPRPPSPIGDSEVWSYGGAPVTAPSEGGLAGALLAYYSAGYDSCVVADSSHISCHHFPPPQDNGTTDLLLVGFTSTCAAGYTVSGTTCVVNSPVTVQKVSDGKRAIQRVGNIFTADPLDITDTLPVNVVGSGTGTITVKAGDGGVTSIAAASDGTAVITDTQPNTDGLTSTQNKLYLGPPDSSSGVPPVTGKSTAQINGVGAVAAAAAAPASTAGAAGSSGDPLDISNLATHGDVSGASAAIQAAILANEMCTKNPTSTACTAKTFGGSCGAGFTCSGDAIQCAMAQSEYTARCQDMQTDSTSDLGAAMIAGTDTLPGVDPIAHPSEFSIASTLDTSSTLSKSCLTDQEFTIVGQSIPLPLSRLCDGLQIAGEIVLAFSYMISARIIFS